MNNQQSEEQAIEEILSQNAEYPNLNVTGIRGFGNTNIVNNTNSVSDLNLEKIKSMYTDKPDFSSLKNNTQQGDKK